MRTMQKLIVKHNKKMTWLSEMRGCPLSKKLGQPQRENGALLPGRLNADDFITELVPRQKDFVSPAAISLTSPATSDFTKCRQN